MSTTLGNVVDMSTRPGRRRLTAALRIGRTHLRLAAALRIGARITSLYIGLALFGVSIALMVSAGLGLDPWDVFHQGVSERTGLSLGWIVNVVGVLVLLAWIPLRQRPGLGTISNVILVGIVADATLPVLPAPHAWPSHSWLPRAALLAAGILANAVATGLYIGAGFGPGPRDGLMTGLARRGHSIRAVRSAIELSVLAVGWLLGGTVGIGTIAYAVTIGPLAHVLIPLLSFNRPPGTPADATPRTEPTHV